MNYGALYTTGLFRGSYVNDPEEKFWHCLLKEMIFTIRVCFMCTVGCHQRARMQAHAAMILAYVLF